MAVILEQKAEMQYQNVMERIVAPKSESLSEFCDPSIYVSQFTLLELVNNTTCGFITQMCLEKQIKSFM